MGSKTMDEHNVTLCLTSGEIFLFHSLSFLSLLLCLTTPLSIGDPRQEILNVAEGERVDMIVLGTRGDSALKRFFFCSFHRLQLLRFRFSLFCTQARQGCGAWICVRVCNISRPLQRDAHSMT